MTTIETALRSYRYLLTHKHPDELKQLACVDAALDELTALQSALAQKEKDGERLEERFMQYASAREEEYNESLKSGDEISTASTRGSFCAARDMIDILRRNNAARSESTPAAKE